MSKVEARAGGRERHEVEARAGERERKEAGASEARAFLQRLVLAELIARRGEGPLALRVRRRGIPVSAPPQAGSSDEDVSGSEPDEPR